MNEHELFCMSFANPPQVSRSIIKFAPNPLFTKHPSAYLSEQLSNAPKGNG